MPEHPLGPVANGLDAGSSLQDSVCDGIQAVRNADRDSMDTNIRTDFVDSLDLDTALQEQFPDKPRWDYLLGHSPSAMLIGLEPHSARQDQITKVIKKKEAAEEQLRGHLKQGARIADWLWVASGNVHFPPTGKAKLRLDQKGIRFVGRRVEKKHLPKARATKVGRPDPGKRPQ